VWTKVSEEMDACQKVSLPLQPPSTFCPLAKIAAGHTYRVGTRDNVLVKYSLGEIKISSKENLRQLFTKPPISVKILYSLG